MPEGFVVEKKGGGAAGNSKSQKGKAGGGSSVVSSSAGSSRTNSPSGSSRPVSRGNKSPGGALASPARSGKAFGFDDFGEAGDSDSGSSAKYSSKKGGANRTGPHSPGGGLDSKPRSPATPNRPTGSGGVTGSAGAGTGTGTARVPAKEQSGEFRLSSLSRTAGASPSRKSKKRIPGPAPPSRPPPPETILATATAAAAAAAASAKGGTTSKKQPTKAAAASSETTGAQSGAGDSLGEQYLASGAPQGLRAEIEMLREEIKVVGKELQGMANTMTISRKQTIPALPQDFASQIVETERKMRSLQTQLDEKLAILNKKVEVAPAAVLPLDEEAKRMGITRTAAAIATGDIWGRDKLCDIVRLVERQKQNRFNKSQQSKIHVNKGLTLLDSVIITDPVARVAAHERDMVTGRSDSLYVSEDFQQMAGIKKLKFLNMKKVKSMAQANTVGLQPALLRTGGAGSAAAVGASQASRLAKALSDKLLYQFDLGAGSTGSVGAGAGGGSITDLGSGGAGTAMTNLSNSHSQRRHQMPEVQGYETVREISVLSTRTNLKYMKIGNAGVLDLAGALQFDEIVTELCLAGARISSAGMLKFAPMLPDIKALRHLDLSCNAICNTGAVALAAALPFCVLLEQCSLEGNRIGAVGAVRIIQSVFVSPVSWIR
jgi:hypothetical protein